MNKKLIFENYSDVYIAPGGAIYIPLHVLKEIMGELFKNGFEVFGYEFLRIYNEGTQPFMQYSIWNEKGFSFDEILENIVLLESSILSSGIDTKEIYFDILVNHKG